VPRLGPADTGQRGLQASGGVELNGFGCRGSCHGKGRKKDC